MNNSNLIDPCTKDYVIDENGKLVSDKTLKTPAYFRLKVPRNKWLYAPNNRYGSLLYQIKKNSTQNNINIVNTASRALAPLVEDGRASDFEISLKNKSRNGSEIDISIEEKNETEKTISIVPIGGSSDN